MNLFCKKCGKEKEAGDFYTISIARKDGTNRVEAKKPCKECKKEYSRMKHPKKGTKGNGGWGTKRFKKSQEEKDEKRREYARRPDRKEKAKEYRKRPDRKDVKREYRRSPEAKELLRAGRVRNKEQRSKYRKEYKSNPSKADILMAARRRYNEKHPRKYKYTENRRIYNQRRKARHMGLERTFNKKDWRDALAHFENRCAYCGKEEVKLYQDHFIALSKGGAYTRSNIVPACFGCNSKEKRDQHPLDWLVTKEHGFLCYQRITDYFQQIVAV